MSTKNASSDRLQFVPTLIKLPVLLIGSRSVGKTTVGKLLASKLQVPFIDMAKVCHQYWQEIGFDEQLLDRAWEEDRANGIYHYLMPFAAHAIERGIAEHPNSVIELGALQSVFDDDELLQRVCQILQPYNVVLLLPSKEVKKSIRILKERDRIFINGIEINEHFLKHHSNYNLAKYTIYTKDRTPEQTCQDILAQIDPNASDIILIGAQGAGKSTIGRLLAQKLGLPQVSMDRLRWNYYQEVGWSQEKQQTIAENEGFAGVYHYWKQYDLYALERLLDEHTNCVIDFGAGHSIYEESEDLERASELLAPYTNIILLLPSSDLAESIAILEKRNQLIINGMEANRFTITHPSNWELATHVVCTERQTPIETRDEILQYLQSKS